MRRIMNMRQMIDFEIYSYHIHSQSMKIVEIFKIFLKKFKLDRRHWIRRSS